MDLHLGIMYRASAYTHRLMWWLTIHSAQTDKYLNEVYNSGIIQRELIQRGSTTTLVH